MTATALYLDMSEMAPALHSTFFSTFSPLGSWLLFYSFAWRLLFLVIGANGRHGSDWDGNGCDESGFEYAWCTGGFLIDKRRCEMIGPASLEENDWL